MTILSDRHHSGLAHSLKLLFEDRLDGKIYFPIGMEWAEEKWWLIHKPYNYNLNTAKQFLQIRPEYKPMDGTVPLNHNVKEFPTHYEVEDLHENYIQKCITLEQFKNMDVDIIIASIPDHWESFTKLRDKYKPNAKVICQMGNMFHEVEDMLRNGTIKNFMSSTIPFPVPCNAVFYHQEFDLNIFKPSNLPPEKRITNFINVLHNNEGYADYLCLKASMPDWEFKSYGAQNDDGVMNTTEEIATVMQRSAWGFQSKKNGDGMGHILYNWFACGRPTITRLSDYKGKLGEELLTDLETCLLLDNHSYSDIYSIISTMPPIKYEWMCSQVQERFTSKVNYSEETIKIKAFLSKLR